MSDTQVIFEKSVKGRIGASLPESAVPEKHQNDRKGTSLNSSQVRTYRMTKYD